MYASGDGDGYYTPPYDIALLHPPCALHSSSASGWNRFVMSAIDSPPKTPSMFNQQSERRHFHTTGKIKHVIEAVTHEDCGTQASSVSHGKVWVL